MKKIPNSPPQSPSQFTPPPEKSEKVYESTGQRVNEFWGLKSLLWVCYGSEGSEKQNTYLIH